MQESYETRISRAILTAYQDKLSQSLENDAVVAGAGPAGLMAAYDLARGGFRVCVVEKRLTPGGGIWGGGMGCNEVVLQAEILPILDELGVRHARHFEELYVADAMELASALCLKALHAGATLLNLITVEDICLLEGRVAGIVVNRTMLSGALPIDPITLMARAVVDATGHDASVVHMLRKRALLDPARVAPEPGEGPMDAVAAEHFVVNRVAEVFRGLWVAGMSVCTTFGGPRMGPIFGGMLLSGRRVAELLAAHLPPKKPLAAA